MAFYDILVCHFLYVVRSILCTYLTLKQLVSCGESRPGPPNPSSFYLGPGSLGLSILKKSTLTRQKDPLAAQGWDGTLAMGPVCTEELRNCHWKLSFGNWKHLKYDFSFHNSSLKNQRIEWWKQKRNRLLSSGSHHFWVMDDGNNKSKQPLI